MHTHYECQICRYLIEEMPPEWCPICGGHRVIFKRLAFAEGRGHASVKINEMQPCYSKAEIK